MSYRINTEASGKIPEAYLAAVRAEQEAFSQRAQASSPAIAESELWLERSGQQSQDSRLTVVYPVYNEHSKGNLPGFFHSLAALRMAPDVEADILIITNNCKDASSIEIQTQIGHQFGGINTELVPDYLKKRDDRLKKYMAVSSRDAQRFIQIDTPTPSKAHVLNLANAWALQNGHRAVVSFDSDVFPHPAALAYLYGHLREISKGGTGVATYGVSHIERSNWLWTKLMGTAKEAGQNTQYKEGSGMNGWGMAWDPEWLARNGGVPLVKVEDYALGVLARVDGIEVPSTENAEIWGYGPSGPRENARQKARYVAGRLQLIDQRPDLVEIVRKDMVAMRDFPGRMHAMQEIIRSGRIIHTPIHLANAALGEYARWAGENEYRKQPFNASWEGREPVKRDKKYDHP